MRECRIFGFLAKHPDSSLLATVQAVWPEWVDLRPERRARTWFIVKEQLFVLQRRGLLKYREDDGIFLWSLT